MAAAAEGQPLLTVGVTETPGAASSLLQDDESETAHVNDGSLDNGNTTDDTTGEKATAEDIASELQKVEAFAHGLQDLSIVVLVQNCSLDVASSFI
mmetsp:Transcript_44478/g.79855  ORF Transcript_44478/g.79855 Transcript_44478/m.79855 type:complete len:96 (-) Transcript_44478:9-296(-)